MHTGFESGFSVTWQPVHKVVNFVGSVFLVNDLHFSCTSCDTSCGTFVLAQNVLCLQTFSVRQHDASTKTNSLRNLFMIKCRSRKSMILIRKVDHLNKYLDSKYTIRIRLVSLKEKQHRDKTSKL